MSAGPARSFGLPVPRIAVGEPANLVALDLDAQWTVSADGFKSRSVELVASRLGAHGCVIETVANGRVVYSA